MSIENAQVLKGVFSLYSHLFLGATRAQKGKRQQAWWQTEEVKNLQLQRGGLPLYVSDLLFLVFNDI